MNKNCEYIVSLWKVKYYNNKVPRAGARTKSRACAMASRDIALLPLAGSSVSSTNLVLATKNNPHLYEMQRNASTGELYFVTMTVIGWIDLFIPHRHNDFITENPNWCEKNANLYIYASVIY